MALPDDDIQWDKMVARPEMVDVALSLLVDDIEGDVPATTDDADLADLAELLFTDEADVAFDVADVDADAMTDAPGAAGAAGAPGAPGAAGAPDIALADALLADDAPPPSEQDKRTEMFARADKMVSGILSGTTGAAGAAGTGTTGTGAAGAGGNAKAQMWQNVNNRVKWPATDAPPVNPANLMQAPSPEESETLAAPAANYERALRPDAYADFDADYAGIDLFDEIAGRAPGGFKSRVAGAVNFAGDKTIGAVLWPELRAESGRLRHFAEQLVPQLSDTLSPAEARDILPGDYTDDENVRRLRLSMDALEKQYNFTAGQIASIRQGKILGLPRSNKARILLADADALGRSYAQAGIMLSHLGIVPKVQTYLMDLGLKQLVPGSGDIAAIESELPALDVAALKAPLDADDKMIVEEIPANAAPRLTAVDTGELTFGVPIRAANSVLDFLFGFVPGDETRSNAEILDYAAARWGRIFGDSIEKDKKTQILPSSGKTEDENIRALHKSAEQLHYRYNHLQGQLFSLTGEDIGASRSNAALQIVSNMKASAREYVGAISMLVRMGQKPEVNRQLWYMGMQQFNPALAARVRGRERPAGGAGFEEADVVKSAIDRNF